MKAVRRHGEAQADFTFANEPDLGLIIIATALLFIKMIAEPFHQMFVLNDIRIGHPWAEVERVDVCTS